MLLLEWLYELVIFLPLLMLLDWKSLLKTSKIEYMNKVLTHFIPIEIH